MVAYLLGAMVIGGFLATVCSLIGLVINVIKGEGTKAWVAVACAGLVFAVAGLGVLAITSSRAEQHLYRAMVTTNLDESIIEYNKALQLNPFNPTAYNNRGNAYYENSEYDQAISDFTKAIELKYYYWEAYSGRGEVYADKGDFDKAISDFTKAIELNFNYDLIKAWDYYRRGKVYADEGILDKAISDFTRAIELDFSYAEAYYARGLAYEKWGMNENAIADF